jgi:hypothetical protein
MANEEHLKILKQDLDMWDQWRQEHPTSQPDLIRQEEAHNR